MTATNWFNDIGVPLVSVLFFTGTASVILKKNWFKVRPVFSAYILTLATTGLLLMPLYLGEIHPSQIQYTVCRVYSVGYSITEILIYVFSIAVLYEFLFCMAGNKKVIQKIAITGFVITTALTIASAYKLMTLAPPTSSGLADAAAFLGRMTSLSLFISGLFIFAIKAAKALILETKLAIALAAIAFFYLIQLLIDFTLRGHAQIGTIASQVISIIYAIILYVAVRNGPVHAIRVADN